MDPFLSALLLRYIGEAFLQIKIIVMKKKYSKQQTSQTDCWKPLETVLMMNPFVLWVAEFQFWIQVFVCVCVFAGQVAS